MTPLPRLMVAPTGARKSKSDHTALPITLPEIVETAVTCHAAGADGIHLHIRDDAGLHTLDADRYLDAIAALKIAVPDMAVQITTEAVGTYSAAQQRSLVEIVKPQLVSISLAEMYSDGEDEAIRSFYAACEKDHISVQHILYSVEDAQHLTQLVTQGVLNPTSLQLIFVLGRYTVDQTSSPDDLTPFFAWLTDQQFQPDWGICAFGPKETECLIAAHHLGGKLRVGFENSFWNRDGSIASNNAERVTEIRNAIN